MHIVATICSIIAATQSTGNKLQLRLDKRSAFFIYFDRFTILHTQAVGSVLIAGFIRTITIRFDVCIKLPDPGYYVCIASIFCLPGSIQATCKQLVFAAAKVVISIAGTAFKCKAISAFSVCCFIVTQLVHIEAAIKAACRIIELTACIACPDAVTVYFIGPVIQVAQPLAQRVIGITPQCVAIVTAI